VIRAVIAAVLGAVLGAGALVAAYARDPGLTFEMDTPLPAFVSGVYSSERDGQTSFVWTSDRMTIDVPDLDRHSAWSCTLRFRGPRPEGLPAPVVDVLVDDARAKSVTAAGDFVDLGFSIPAGKRGLRLAVGANPAYSPGTADKRLLGIQIDRLQCRPASFAWPPAGPVMQVAAAAGFAGLMFVLMGLSLGTAVAGAAILAAGAVGMLATAAGIYGDFSNSVLRITVWVVAAAAAASTSADRLAGRRLTTAARLVFALSAIAICLKMFGLLHPAKPEIDAAFHAHRLEYVIGGNRHFTQPFPGGVQMPYALGLYVFAWPWTWIFTDHVALIRGVTAISDVLAGALLYPVIVRGWGNRRSAVLAVLFYQLAPVGYALLGDANLTNLFGQSVALVAMSAAIAWSLAPRRLLSLAAFTALVAWAFCSHVSTVTMLIATLGLLVLLYWWKGDAARRGAAAAIVLAVAAALALSWIVFYRDFAGDISAAFSRMFSGGGGAAAATAEEAARGFKGTGERLRDLLAQAISSAGLPMVLLAIIGTWAAWRRGVRDRLVSALIAWAVFWLVFSASTVFSRVDPEFVRYTIEFLGRINLAAIPMVAILAASGAAAGWDEDTPTGARAPLKATSIALLSWSVWIASTSLMGWFSR